MSFISRLFGNNDDEFQEVRVDKEVLDSVIYYSKQAYPNEFLAFFDGKIRNKILYITSLIFIPGETCETGAVVHTEILPMNTKYFGSVHSHPGPSASPSSADLMTFSKNGYFHMIVCLPYSYETFRAYDGHGNPIEYSVGDYSYLINEDIEGFFDEEDVLTDNDEFHPGFFDEDDDEFFQNIDEEKVNQYDEFEKRNQTNDNLQNNIIRIELYEDGSVKKISREPKD
ncbi:MAG: Mov34/MPN/PAD-1 family protein [Methanobrevibacter sp.]|uniref:Mov34/MPN/PAD-1 family protein n=1 Tax=Methanobrevibacter sp. TaxID=66852 RepID=UPI003F07C993